MDRNPPRTVVLARSLQEFHAWCRQAGRSPRDRSLLYASGPHALRNLVGDVEIVRYGSWSDRPDGHALEDAVAALEHRGVCLLAAASV
jgi:hypothetical protein